jgi:hypothetical protein
MSDANRTIIRYDEETAFGVTDSPAPTMQDIRFVSDSLKFDTTIARSRQIVSDRMIADIARTDVQVSGDINIEMSAGMHDAWIVAAMGGAALDSEDTETSAEFDAVAADNSINRTTGDFTTDIEQYDWIQTSGYTNAANNGYFKVLTVATLKITLEGGTLVDEAGAAGHTIDVAAQTVNGTTERYYTIEKEFVDTADFELHNGCAIDGFSLNTNVRNLVEGSFTVLGASTSSDTSTAGDGSPTAAPSNPVFNAIDDVVASLEAGATTNMTNVTQFNMTWAGNHRTLPVIGTLAPTSMGVGSFNATGKIQTYFESNALIDKYLNFTTSSLALIFQKGTNAYVFDYPSVKFTAGQRVIPGQDDDVLADLDWEAFKDATEGIMVRFCKFTGVS